MSKTACWGAVGAAAADHRVYLYAQPPPSNALIGRCCRFRFVSGNGEGLAGAPEP
jgi:hypothetical protein